VSKAFGSQWALRNVSFELGSGDCVALLGPNGAGKTTLLKIVAALIQPTSGAVEIEPGPRELQSNHARARVGYFVPGTHFYDHLTASENLHLFLSLYGKKKTPAELDEALGRVGLRRWRDDYVSALSSGMKCRLVIAKWILLEPPSLLFDEPYGPLDGPGVDLLESFVAELICNQKTVVIATHQVPRALEVCARALILNRGKLIFDGPCREAWANVEPLVSTLLPQKDRWKS
jgi:ABC-type multidrug transport system ATPase subunit